MKEKTNSSIQLEKCPQKPEKMRGKKRGARTVRIGNKKENLKRSFLSYKGAHTVSLGTVGACLISTGGKEYLQNKPNGPGSGFFCRDRRQKDLPPGKKKTFKTEKDQRVRGRGN